MRIAVPAVQIFAMHIEGSRLVVSTDCATMTLVVLAICNSRIVCRCIDGMATTELSCRDDVQPLYWTIFESGNDVLEVVAILLVDALAVHHIQLVAELAVVRLSKE